MGFITKIQSNPTSNIKKRVLFTTVPALLLLIMNVVLLFIDPVLLIAKYNSRVAYNTFTHEGLLRESKGIYLSTYLFNVTNAEEFRAGLDSKLKVEEVGPFTYLEYRTNEMLEIDLAAEVIRYSPKIRTVFLPEKSIARPEDVNVTMPNIAMLSMASKMSTFSLIPRMGFNLLASRLKSKPMVDISVADYLWGYDEPLISLGHNLMPGFVNFDKLGILDRLYDKKSKFLLEVSANHVDKFAIRTVNDSRGLDIWGYKTPNKRTICNTFKDVYEGIVYPTEMTAEQKVRIYRHILCRFLELDYKGVKQSYGAQGLEYRISNRTFAFSEETQCLCGNGICREGISDMSPCMLGLPVVLSNAHFLYADPALYERVEGMRPDEERHGSSFVIEPMIGMALETKFSVQVNILVRDVSFNSDTRPYSDMIVPVAYVKIEQPRLSEKSQYDLRIMYTIGPAIVLSIQILLLVTSVALIAYSIILVYSRWVSTNTGIVLQTNVDVKSVEQPLVGAEELTF